MSEFFKILEQAERDRALQKETGGRTTGTVLSPVAPPVDETLPAVSPTEVAPPLAPIEGAPPLAPPAGADGVEGHLVSLLYPNSYLAEPYRVIRHRVEHLHRTAQLSVIAVTSAAAGDGKTTTAINLAGALAQAPGARVLLVDADLRRPSIARNLALDAVERGLVDAVIDPTLCLQTVIRSLPLFNLDVLPAGTVPPAPYEILESPRLAEMLTEARGRYDYVVLDTAPLVPIPDSQLLAKLVDGILLVVGAHKAPRKMLAEALNILDPAKLVGLVFNEDDQRRSGYDYDGYGTYGAYAAPHNGDGPDGGRRRWWQFRQRRARPSSGKARARRRRFWTRKGLAP